MAIQEKYKKCIRLTGSAHESCLNALLICFHIFFPFFLSKPEKQIKFTSKLQIEEKNSFMYIPCYDNTVSLFSEVVELATNITVQGKEHYIKIFIKDKSLILNM